VRQVDAAVGILLRDLAFAAVSTAPETGRTNPYLAKEGAPFWKKK
jgi:hypothetical protein